MSQSDILGFVSKCCLCGQRAVTLHAHGRDWECPACVEVTGGFGDVDVAQAEPAPKVKALTEWGVTSGPVDPAREAARRAMAADPYARSGVVAEAAAREGFKAGLQMAHDMAEAVRNEAAARITGDCAPVDRIALEAQVAVLAGSMAALKDMAGTDD